MIVWHLLADRLARYHDLDADCYTNRIGEIRNARNHVRQLETLGYTITLT